MPPLESIIIATAKTINIGESKMNAIAEESMSNRRFITYSKPFLQHFLRLLQRWQHAHR